MKWAERFKRNKGKGVVSAYEFNLNDCRTSCSVLQFKGYSEEWLDFITSCRRLENTSTYDLVIGGVANDKVFNTIELYFEGLIEKTEAIKRLWYEKPNQQICVRNQELIERYMQFKERRDIYMEANPILLQKKYARVIVEFAREAGITNRKAMDFFYHSITYKDMSEGISDFHCRSDEYLAQELKEEYLHEIESKNG